MTSDNDNNSSLAAQQPANWIDEEAQPGVVYIKPNIEIKLTDQKRQECREIVREIKAFGINQRQILFIMDLLALEVEDMNLARKLREVVQQHREQLTAKEESGLVSTGEPQKPGLILP